MTASIQKQVLSSQTVSNIILKGDISGLKPEEKVQYYRDVCDRIGVDPATQPFQLLKLSGKEVLYATKSCAEQLTKIHKISHEIKDRAKIEDVFIVYARASEVESGRFEDSSGAVSIGGLKGEALANAMMKAETKAKRRATLSLLGLGMMDETEVETIPNAVSAPIEPPKTKAPVFTIAEGTEAEAQIDDAIISEETEDSEKLKYEDDKLPIGKNKGRRFRDIPSGTLKTAVSWMKEHNESGKFTEVIEHATIFLNDSGMNL